MLHNYIRVSMLTNSRQITTAHCVHLEPGVTTNPICMTCALVNPLWRSSFCEKPVSDRNTPNHISLVFFLFVIVGGCQYKNSPFSHIVCLNY